MLTNAILWKRPLVLKAVWNPKGRTWGPTWLDKHCSFTWTFQVIPFPNGIDPVLDEVLMLQLLTRMKMRSLWLQLCDPASYTDILLLYQENQQPATVHVLKLLMLYQYCSWKTIGSMPTSFLSWPMMTLLLYLAFSHHVELWIAIKLTLSHCELCFPTLNFLADWNHDCGLILCLIVCSFQPWNLWPLSHLCVPYGHFYGRLLTDTISETMVTTYQTRASSAAEHQYFMLRSRRAVAELVDPPLRPAVPLRRCRVNMTVIVEIEGILPEGCVHFLTGEPLLYMDVVPICEFHSEAQLHNTTVDDIKWEIQDLCWQCLGVSVRKRDFKLWL